MTAAQSTLVIVWSVGTMGSLYAIFGGLKAVAISDTVNGIGFLAAGLLVSLLGAGGDWRRQRLGQSSRSLCRGSSEV